MPVSVSLRAEPIYKYVRFGDHIIENNIASLFTKFSQNMTPALRSAIKTDNDWLPYLFPMVNQRLPNGVQRAAIPVDTLLSPFLVLAPLITQQHVDYAEDEYLVENFERILGAMITEALARVTILYADTSDDTAQFGLNPSSDPTYQTTRFEAVGHYYGWGKFGDRLNFWFSIGIICFISWFLYPISYSGSFYRHCSRSSKSKSPEI